MGQVLNATDFASARAVREAKLGELGMAPICMAPGAMDEGHSHTVVEEIVIVQAGEGSIQIENETFPLCAGSVAVVPAGQFHALCNTGNVNFEAVTIFNSNFDRDKVVLKTREEHFGAAGSDDANSAQLAELTATIGELKSALAKLEKKSKKRK